jgi:hypothetical protein
MGVVLFPVLFAMKLFLSLDFNYFIYKVLQSAVRVEERCDCFSFVFLQFPELNTKNFPDNFQAP